MIEFSALSCLILFIRSHRILFVSSLLYRSKFNSFTLNMTNTIVEKFQNECSTYLNTRLSSSSRIFTDQTTSEYYLNEYKRCVDEQMNFIHYLTEQIDSLNHLKSSEMAIDTLSEHLQAAHEYELKQNELLEQILRELTTSVRLISFFFHSLFYL